MTNREVWQTRKTEAENAFKKEHAGELLDVHRQGLTAYPVKFELGLGPVLKNLDDAVKNKKATDVQKYKLKAKEIVGKYKVRINGKKTELGTAFEPLNHGITYLETALK
jgi:hypothetical protein